MKNIINWKNEEKSEFLFDDKTKSVTTKQDYIFSLIVAVYNVENYIEETIQSVLNQDIGFKNNIQLILVDDGSTDKSFEICKQYAKKYPNNIILIHKENGGVSSARNIGMKFASGKYINFLDSDDKFSNNVCSKVLEFFNKYENKTDVVTIRTELFGAKKGDTWFNKKFSKGTRLIDLWKEPQIFLNSTNCTFFHSRIKNQLVFDEGISIAEDLKVVNTALMNKWTLGVVSNCLYYYRIRQGDSLATGARNRKEWYITYLDRVFIWLYKKAFAQASFFPEFLQYTLCRDLFNRFSQNTECEKVLTKEEIVEYKQKLFEALSLISDKVIQSVDVINKDYQVYFFYKKYGKPTITTNGEETIFYWKEQNIKIAKKLCTMFENCEVKNKTLKLEGYIIHNNVGLELKNSSICFNIKGIGNIKPVIIDNTKNNNLAFADEYVFYRKYFKIDIPLNKKFKGGLVNISGKMGGKIVGFNYCGNCKWFGLSANTENSYYYQKRVLVCFKDKKLFVKKSNWFGKVWHELKYLKTLKTLSKKDENIKKYFKARLAHHLLKLIKFRPIWIVSDRDFVAGDNGEAFYNYVRKNPLINSYFAISKDCPDYLRLKKQGFKLLDVRSTKYKLKFLMADHIVSAFFENDQLLPFNNKFNEDIFQKKKYVFLQHGITKDDVSSIYSRKFQKLDMFVTSATAEYNSIIKNPNYFCDKTVTKLTGFARYDKLENNPQKIIIIVPTWRRALLEKLDHSTGIWSLKQGYNNSYYFNFYNGLFKNNKLQKVLEEYGYKVLFVPHENMQASNSFFETNNNFSIVPEKEKNYSQLFSHANLLVTDYSSTAFDFAYLRKPVLYCQGDKQEFFSSHTYSKGYFDYEKDGFGKVVYNIDQTVDEITNLIKNNCNLEQKYLKRINNFFAFNDKNNCKRIYEEIKDL